MTGDNANPIEKVFCSFCGKDNLQVRRLCAGWTTRGAVFICDECIILAAQIIAGGDKEWRDKFIAGLSEDLSSQ
jgi:ATP-dependent protease Clp ATPase subunit